MDRHLSPLPLLALVFGLLVAVAGDADGSSVAPQVAAASATTGLAPQSAGGDGPSWNVSERVSVASSGTEANWSSGAGELSGDGRYVAFVSGASNLVSGDTNTQTDVFVRDRVLGVTERVSVSSSGSEHDGELFGAMISDDGRYVAFAAQASNLVAGDTNGSGDVFVRDRVLGVTERVSVNSSGTEADYGGFGPSISSDGRYVAFHSNASNLVPGDTNTEVDVFVHDRMLGVTERVSVGSAGIEAAGRSESASISGDGRYVAFSSEASNLVAGDTNAEGDVFVHDRVSGTTSRVSVDSSGTQGNQWSGFPSISADGRYVVFESVAPNLVDGDTNTEVDVFVHDRMLGVTERVSVDNSGSEANGGSRSPSISADGRHVAFASDAANLIDGETNTHMDVFVHDRVLGITLRISLNSSGTEANDDSFGPSISADGRHLAFTSEASNLVVDDANAMPDAFVAESMYFLDIAGSVFESDIEWLAATGITKGCNPPLDTMFCPSDFVTRGQMAAFLVRALDLTDDGGGNSFVDDDGSVFEVDIAKLAAAGITRGCNPPVNDQFCPGKPVTRGQMAAFLVRALDLTDDGGGNSFVDDDGSVFDVDIAKLAAAGITRGCNPPVNDEFCPGRSVTRGQMAAFLHRALGG